MSNRQTSKSISLCDRTYVRGGRTGMQRRRTNGNPEKYINLSRQCKMKPNTNTNRSNELKEMVAHMKLGKTDKTNIHRGSRMLMSSRLTSVTPDLIKYEATTKLNVTRHNRIYTGSPIYKFIPIYVTLH